MQIFLATISAPDIDDFAMVMLAEDDIQATLRLADKALRENWLPDEGDYYAVTMSKCVVGTDTVVLDQVEDQTFTLVRQGDSVVSKVATLVKAAAGSEPYWFELVDDCGDPEMNVRLSYDSAEKLAVWGIHGVLDESEFREVFGTTDIEKATKLVEALVPGQQYEFDLDNGRLYYGMAE